MFENTRTPTVGFIAGAMLGLFAAGALASSSMIFQNNGTYTGCTDTYLQADAAATTDVNYGTEDKLCILGLPTTPGRAILIRFDGLFGPGSNQIPASATIISATFAMTAYYRDTTATSQYVAVYPMRSDWAPGTAQGITQEGSSCMNARHYRPDGQYDTYPTDAWGTDGLVHPGPVEGTDYASASTASCAINPTGAGTYENNYVMAWNITSLVQAWKTNPASNFGLYAYANSSDVTVYFRSSNYTNSASQRPQLTIEYTLPLVSVSLSGTVVPQNYTADLSDLGVKIQLIRAGGVVREEKMFLDAAGRFVFDNVTPGTYDVAVRIGGWLKKVLPARDLSAPTDLGPIPLPGGDTDGDNAVTSTDLSMVLTNMDRQGN